MLAKLAKASQTVAHVTEILQNIWLTQEFSFILLIIFKSFFFQVYTVFIFRYYQG